MGPTTTRRRRATAAYAALSLADTLAVGLGSRGRRTHTLVKPLLMPALAATLAGSRGPGIRSVLAAQGLSWAGDVALMRDDDDARLLAGVGSFFAAHLAYVAAFRELGAGSPTAHRAGRAVLAASTVLVPLNAVAAGRREPRLAGPVGVYGLVLIAMGATATALPDHPGVGRVQAGAGLFLLSDSLLGAQLFLREEPHRFMDAAVMATYTAGQWLISDGVRRSRSRPSL